jgi:excisionase family DNA binding protein
MGFDLEICGLAPDTSVVELNRISHRTPGKAEAEKTGVIRSAENPVFAVFKNGLNVCSPRDYVRGVNKSDNSSNDAPNPEQISAPTPPPVEALPRLAYTMRETAEILGVSYITVFRLLKRGKLRASDALRSKIIPRTEIERFLRDSISDAA